MEPHMYIHGELGILLLSCLVFLLNHLEDFGRASERRIIFPPLHCDFSRGALKTALKLLSAFHPTVRRATGSGGGAAEMHIQCFARRRRIMTHTDVKMTMC